MYWYEIEKGEQGIFRHVGVLELLPAFDDGVFAGFQGVAWNNSGTKRIIFTQENGFRVIVAISAGADTSLRLETRAAYADEARSLIERIEEELDRKKIKNRGPLEFLYKQALKRFRKNYPQ